MRSLSDECVCVSTLRLCVQFKFVGSQHEFVCIEGCARVCGVCQYRCVRCVYTQSPKSQAEHKKHKNTNDTHKLWSCPVAQHIRSPNQLRCPWRTSLCAFLCVCCERVAWCRVPFRVLLVICGSFVFCVIMFRCVESVCTVGCIGVRVLWVRVITSVLLL